MPEIVTAHPGALTTSAELAAGQRTLVKDLAWASITGAFSGGVILVAFALALGASPLQIGLLAAIPFIAQAAQLPATLLIERTRQRRRIALLSLNAARALILSVALIPFLPGTGSGLATLIVAQVLIAVLHAVAACAVNSWLHQLIPPAELGGFFARRLFWGTLMACVATLAAGYVVELRLGDSRLTAYGLAFALAALAGFVSSHYLAQAPEPMMRDAGPVVPLLQRLSAPFHDRNFRRLLIFLGAWTIAANLAGPFLTVYLIEQRGYAVTTVTTLWVTSQLANALTLYAWGRLSDRLSNKAILAVVLPLNFLCLFGLVFVNSLPSPNTRLAFLYLIHILLGIAGGGIGLATGNLGLKLAPQGQGTVYLAAIGLVSAFAGGIAPILAGALAQSFKASALSMLIRWSSPGDSGEMVVISLSHWEFLFALSALGGLYVMHALSLVAEGSEVSERLVIQEFALEAWRSLNSLSSAAGSLNSLFSFERPSERRLWWRSRLPGGKPRPGSG